MEECIVCHRIPPKEVFAFVHKVLDSVSSSTQPYSKEEIHHIGATMCALINIADKEDRIFFCGHKRAGILGGLLYLVCLDMDKRLTQNDIAYKTELVESVTIRDSYSRWYKRFPSLFPKAKANTRGGTRKWVLKNLKIWDEVGK